MKVDVLVVGAGFSGSVVAERLASHGLKVLVIDKRAHIGGNAYDRLDAHGVLIHPYGPHIFHTNAARIAEYLSQFTDWRFYEHRVLAKVGDRLVPVPINIDTVNAVYGLSLTEATIQAFFDTVREPRSPLKTSEDVALNAVGANLYEKFFRGYTRKQWGLDPSELDAQVTARVPVRTNRDDRYFTDTYQAMPAHGFTRMFENMLDHENIKIMLNADYRDVVDEVNFSELIFTGPVDEFFEYRYGPLP
ncbi:MAG TPA: FAD-dependent oxidoreductase, partial [Burkholderiales bacterium]|nr:FAD-dependent oxidoreductase [Burkholderiales bacterium]